MALLTIPSEDGLTIECPSKETIDMSNAISEPYVKLMLNMLKNNIATCKEMTVFENAFTSPEIFAHVMSAIGTEFATNDAIEVCYEKPEDKDNYSPTFGHIIPKIVIRNIETTNKEEQAKLDFDALSAENQKLKKSVQNLVEKISKKD